MPSATIAAAPVLINPSRPEPQSPISGGAKPKTLVKSLRKPNETTPAEELATEPIERRLDIGLDVILQAWLAYSALVLARGEALLGKLLEGLIIAYKDDYLVEVRVNSNLERDTLKENQSTLMTYMRQQTGHQGLQLNIVVTEVAQVTGIYSAQDKYEALAAAYPMVRQLREELGLGLDA